MDRKFANKLGIWAAIVVSVITVIGFLWNISHLALPHGPAPEPQ